VKYQMRPPKMHTTGRPDNSLLYIHPPNRPVRRPESELTPGAGS